MKLMLRTMLGELEPHAAGGWRGREGEWIRRRAITLVPAAAHAWCGSQERAEGF